MSIEEEAGFTVTANCKPIYSRGHNLRLPGYTEEKKNIDPKLTHRNVIIKDMGTEEEVYEKLFGKSVAEYNLTKTKSRDKIKNYYQHVLDDARSGKSANPKSDHSRKPFYEFHFYIGDSFKNPCPFDIARKILTKFVTKVFPKKYPNFVLTCVALHNDEFSINSRTGKRTESAVHIHATGVYVAHALNEDERKEADVLKEQKYKEAKEEAEKKGIKFDSKRWLEEDWKRILVDKYGKYLEKGMELQSSMTAACGEMGFIKEKGKGSVQTLFEENVRFSLMDFAEAYGLKIFRGKGRKHTHLSKELFIQQKTQEKLEEELNKKEKYLEMKEILLEDKKDKFDYTIEHLEEREANIKARESELITEENNLLMTKEKNKMDRLNNEELAYRLADKSDRLQLKETELIQKEQKHNEKEIELLNREQKVLQGEEPYKELANKLNDKSNSLDLIELELNKKEEELNSIKNHIDNKSASINEDIKFISNTLSHINQKQKQLNEKEESIKKKENALEQQHTDQLKIIENKKMEVELIQKQNDEFSQSIYLSSSDKELITDEESKIKLSINSLFMSKREASDFTTFSNTVKTCVIKIVNKIRKFYENKFNKELNGYNVVDVNTNGVKHRFGSLEQLEMFDSSTPDTFRKIADEMINNNCNTFKELKQKEPNCFVKLFNRARKKINELREEKYNSWSR